MASSVGLAVYSLASGVFGPRQHPAGWPFPQADVGPQPHELNLLKLAPGKTAQDVLAWENAPSGPPPFAAVGGVNGLSPTGMEYMTLDLQPGSYVAICHIPDPYSGLPHDHLGMLKAFSVRT